MTPPTVSLNPARIHPAGPAALLLDVDQPQSWFAELWRRKETGDLDVTEIVPGARTVLLSGVRDPVAAAGVVRHIARTGAATTTGSETTTVAIAVTFTGDDLPQVAELWGTDVTGVIDRLCATELHVAFCGFAPGWAYLAGLPEELAVPRLATPRTRVPAGSVALAGAYAGIYPTASPGGWLLVGETTVRLFDPARTPPALLTPGTRVRFVQAAAS